MNPNTTPPGVVSYPHLFKPRAPSLGAEPRFSINLIFDKAAQEHPLFKRMRDEALRIATEKFGSKAQEMLRTGALRSPFRRCSEKEGIAGYEDPDGYFVNLWSSASRPPAVVDGNVEDLGPGDIYPGAIAQATYNPFAYQSSGNRGVSFGLGNVQFIDLTTPRLDGRRAASSDFGAVAMKEAEGGEDAPAGDTEDAPF